MRIWFVPKGLTVSGSLPTHWRNFKVPKGTAVGQFIVNFAARLVQLETIASAPDVQRGIWLGGLFQPEAYITATRQMIAHQKGWSLEQLVLSMEIQQTGGADAFAIEGWPITCARIRWPC